MADTLENKHIVCLGGGIGTVNLVKGLKSFTKNITIVVSPADDGGSAGRLRRLYDIFPPGDAISCIAALMRPEDEEIAKLLTYRFPGNRYAPDGQLAGHKLGNLLFVAAKETAGDVQSGIILLEKLFQSFGKVLPATNQELTLSAKTVDGFTIEGEQKIDLGKYKGKKILQSVEILPNNPVVSKNVLEAIENADVIIAGPGDLYTTILPVLLIPAIKEAVENSKAKKMYVVNVANKPFETQDYAIADYVEAVVKHLGKFPFQIVIANNNTEHPIPKKYKYSYVHPVQNKDVSYELVVEDLVDAAFPLYHDSKKLARAVVNHI